MESYVAKATPAFKPFIGLTHVPFTKGSAWFRAMARAFKSEGGDNVRRVLHGCAMTSFDAIHRMPGEGEQAFPAVEQIAEIFIPDPSTAGIVHFTDHTSRARLEELQSAVACGGIHRQGLQIDIPWVKWQWLTELKADNSELRIILELGHKALSDADNSVEQVMERLCLYSGCIDDVVFNARTARGETRNETFLRPFLEAVCTHFPDLGVGVAIGLGRPTLALMEPLMKAFPKLSIQGERHCLKHGDTTDPDRTARTDTFLRDVIRLLIRTATASPVS